MDLIERFNSKVSRSDDGCIVWAASTTPDGYGKFYHDGTVSLAHRWAYEQARGPVPDGLELDHLCRVRHCVNPEHLEAVTRQENARRGFGPTGLNARKTHCPQGHPYSGENLYVNGAGSRTCRACGVAKGRAYRARLAAKRQGAAS